MFLSELVLVLGRTDFLEVGQHAVDNGAREKRNMGVGVSEKDKLAPQ
jgi:hypothetical protein